MNWLLWLLIAGVAFLVYVYFESILDSYRIDRAKEQHTRATVAYKRIAYIGKLRQTLRAAGGYIGSQPYTTDEKQKILKAIDECLNLGNRKEVK